MEKHTVKNSEKNRGEDESEERESDSEALATNLQELENAHIQFSRSTKEAIISENLKKELDDIKDRIGDMKNGVIAGDAKKESRLWDAVNENGETPLLVTTSLNKSALTNMLLNCKYGSVKTDD